MQGLWVGLVVGCIELREDQMVDQAELPSVGHPLEGRRLDLEEERLYSLRLEAAHNSAAVVVEGLVHTLAAAVAAAAHSLTDAVVEGLVRTLVPEVVDDFAHILELEEEAFLAHPVVLEVPEAFLSLALAPEGQLACRVVPEVHQDLVLDS